MISQLLEMPCGEICAAWVHAGLFLIGFLIPFAVAAAVIWWQDR
jgi:hypothetical protein